MVARLAPPRFLAFAATAAVAVPLASALTDWRQGAMLGFDAAALLFLLACLPLLRETPAQIRALAPRNDANRATLLALTVGVTLVILAAVAAELGQKGAPHPLEVALIVVTLALAWLFSNVVFALHYAHMFYQPGANGGDGGGLSVPDTTEPDYWDMLYFSFTLGMTFQTSDVEIGSRAIRRVVTAHALIAFVFNIGVLAFTVNVLGGG